MGTEIEISLYETDYFLNTNYPSSVSRGTVCRRDIGNKGDKFCGQKTSRACGIVLYEWCSYIIEN